jgi:hypothetical protein
MAITAATLAWCPRLPLPFARRPGRLGPDGQLNFTGDQNDEKQNP